MKAIFALMNTTLALLKRRPEEGLLARNILSMNFFFGIINDALLDAKNNANESELYELINENRCSSSKERKEFFDAISNSLKQSRTSKTSAEVKDKESENIGLDPKNSSNLNFD